MGKIQNINRPTKEEQIIALKSYDALSTVLNELQTNNPEIEIEETQGKIKVPLKTLKLLAKILKATSQGKPVSIVPIATEMTTQAAAEILGCSRPHLVKLLEEGKIPFTKVGKHRRLRYDDVASYRDKMNNKNITL
jgi:excisionase family DNA binding protein